MNIFSDPFCHLFDAISIGLVMYVTSLRHLQVRGWESFSHSVTPKIRKVLENILLWPSDEDESKITASGY